MGGIVLDLFVTHIEFFNLSDFELFLSETQGG